MYFIRKLTPLLLLLAACTGGIPAPGGGTPPAPSPSPSAPQIQTDAQLSSSAEDLLDQASDPEGAFDGLARDVSRLYQALSPADAYDVATVSSLAALRSAADLEAALRASRNLGSVYSTRFLNAGSSLAQATLPDVCGPSSEGGIVVYYVNGVMTTADTAWNTLCDLEALMARAYPDITGEIQFRLFHNKSGLEDPNLFCHALALRAGLSSNAQALSYLASLGNAYRAALQACGAAQDFFQSAQQFLDQYWSRTPDPSEVNGLTNAIQQDVLSGKTVIVVAHSQGNFFAQQAVGRLSTVDRRAVGVVAIASPAAYGDRGTYGDFYAAMLHGDAILCLPGQKPAPNMTNPVGDEVGRVLDSPGDCADGETRRAAVATHGIDTSYLRHASSRNPIRNAIAGMAQRLQNTRDSAGQGYFQVSLQWDLAGDIDLHLYEPGGEHVWFADQVGEVGLIDVDDIVGTGPENYFVCAPELMRSGEYEIWVANYDGITGTRATVRVRAGSQVRSFQVIVGEADSGANPIYVASVHYSGATFSFSGP